MRSDIFEAYTKIAEEIGLVEKDEPKESKQLKKYKNDTHPRAGSDTIETIEALYNVKPDSSIEYKNNIMEAAHPKSVIIAPSYDKINGLIENNNERNQIMCYIARKPNTGVISGHKYAKQELLLELIRTANDLDNAGKEDLRVLADKCISGMKKEALGPLLIVAIGAAVLAGIWLWGHANDPDKGISGNMANAIEQLNDLKTNSWYESDVDAVVQRDVDTLIGHIKNLQRYIKDFNHMMDIVYKPKSLNDKAEFAKFKNSVEQDGAEAKDKIQKFVDAIDQAVPEIIKGINNFSSSIYQKEHTKENWVGNVSGWLGEAIHGRWGLVANDFISAVNALNPLKASLLEARKMANNFDSVKTQEEDSLKNQVAAFDRDSNKGSLDKKNIKEDQELDVDNKEENVASVGGGKEEGGVADIVEFLGHKPNQRELDFFKSLT